MFRFPKKQKTVFSKLYRYYCAKLLKKLGLAFFYFLLFVLILVVQGVSLQNLFTNAVTWQEKLGAFWVVSFVQLYALTQMIIPLVSWLVGRGLGWEELKNKELFKMPKISREEDIKVLIFTLGAERETVIWAKFAATFTYFMVFNFLLVFFGFLYFLFFTNFGIIAAFVFLLLNGIGFGLVNFLLVVPFLFCQQELGSFWSAFFYFIFVIFVCLCFYSLWESIQQNSAIFMLSSALLAVPIGYFFFSSYRKKFLKSDLG